MYAGLWTLDTLHKTICSIGPGLCGTSENAQKAKFAEYLFPRTRVNSVG